MSRAVMAIGSIVCMLVACTDAPTGPSLPVATISGPLAHVAGSWVGTINELDCGPLTIGHCYTWLKTPPPRMWKFTITDSGNSLAGTTDFVVGSETRRSEVKSKRQ